MKTQIVRLIALLIFASVAMSSCSIEYRQRHHHSDEHHDNGDHDHNDRNNNN